MKYAILLGLVLISFGCSTKRPGAGAASSCSNPGYTDLSNPGHICDKSNNWRVMLAGECGLPSGSQSPDGPSLDCPPQFNNCIGNKCVAQAAASGDSQIWFATDPIRPGVNSGDPSGAPTGSGYIYNIMAKGYASLDDWCMSQAQQSTIPAMRNIASWTALIIAQPDNESISIGSNGSNRLHLFSQNPPEYYSASSVLFDDQMHDKNGVASTALVFWTGMGSTPYPTAGPGWACPSGNTAQPYNFDLAETYNAFAPFPGPFAQQYNSNTWSASADTTPTPSYPGGIAYFNGNSGLSQCIAKNYVAFFRESDSTTFNGDSYNQGTNYQEFLGIPGTTPSYYCGDPTKFSCDCKYCYSATLIPNKLFHNDSGQQYGVICLANQS